MKGSVPLIVGAVLLFLLGAVIVAGVVVAAQSGSSTVSATPATPVAARFPAPPTGAVVFARQDDGDALALAVRPAGKKLELQASVVGRQGTGVPGLSVAFRLQPGSKAPLRATACGAGCYRATAPMPSRPRAITVEVARRGRKTVWRVPIETWPPRPATPLVTRAEKAWRHLRSFEFSEHLASDASGGIESAWRVVAPDRLEYEIEGSDSAGVVIGNRRWDRQGGKWKESQQAPLDLPQPTWQSGVSNAHVLGAGVAAGKPITRLSFYDSTGRAWFEIGVDKKTARTLDLHMVTTAHFMRQKFSGFNAPIVIRPPVNGAG